MPKLHALLCYVYQFVRLVGCWEKLSEGEFEHYQSTVASFRSSHSQNSSVGGQIFSNLQYSSFRSFPDVAALRAACEENAEANGFRVNMKQFLNPNSN